MKDEEQDTFDYAPEIPAAPNPGDTQAVSWQASEYIDHEQGAKWFLGLIVVTALVATAAYFMTSSYFTPATIGIVGIIVAIAARHTPRQLSYELDTANLSIGGKKYPLDSFRSFSIIEEGPVSSIELTPLKRLAAPISVFFETTDQDKIVDVLEDRVPYEDRDLDAVERLSRRLHF